MTTSFPADGPAEFWYTTVRRDRGNFKTKGEFMVWVNRWFEDKDRNFASMAWDLVELEEGEWDDSQIVGSKG